MTVKLYGLIVFVWAAIVAADQAGNKPKLKTGNGVHPDRATQIEEIRNTPGVMWTAEAQNRFASEAPGASERMCGVNGNHRGALEAAIASGEITKVEYDPTLAIPDSFDSEENWPHCAKIIGDIRDQSNCGCCWAFAGAEAASDRMCISTNASIMLPLSAQDVCFAASEDGCNGGQINTPWSFIKFFGAVTGGQYKGSGPFGEGLCSDFTLPHCHHHGPKGSDPYPSEGQQGCVSQNSPIAPHNCDGSATTPHNDFKSDKYHYKGATISASGEQAIQQAIMKGGPVETAFTVYADFENYAGGIYHYVTGGMAGGHAVKMVGWGVEDGVKYWKVANSWNPYWGEKGYFRIRRGTGECGIEDGVVASSPTVQWSKKTVSQGQVHPERAAMITQINDSPGVLWRAETQNRFAAEAPGFSEGMCGVKGSHKMAVEEAIARGEIKRLEVDYSMVIPDSFDSAENWPQCAKIIGDIRDQSNCGCCWAFAGAEAASDRMCIATNATIMLPLSAQDVCFGASFAGCNGGMIDTPWSYIKRTGSVTGGQYQGSGPFGEGLCSDFTLPHCHHHGPKGGDPYPAEGEKGCPSERSPSRPWECDSSAKAPHDDFSSDKYSFTGNTISASGEMGIQQAIMAGGPVETAFTVYADFENYAGGIYHHVTGGMAGGHAVKFVGWGVEDGVKYWKVANSWNPYWGERGYFRIRRGNNEGGIEDAVVGSAPDAKWMKKADQYEETVARVVEL